MVLQQQVVRLELKPILMFVLRIPKQMVLIQQLLIQVHSIPRSLIQQLIQQVGLGEEHKEHIVEFILDIQSIIQLEMVLDQQYISELMVHSSRVQQLVESILQSRLVGLVSMECRLIGILSR